MAANFWPKNDQKWSPHLGFEPAPSREQKNEWKSDKSSNIVPRRQMYYLFNFIRKNKYAAKPCFKKMTNISWNRDSNSLKWQYLGNKSWGSRKNNTLVLILQSAGIKKHSNSIIEHSGTSMPFASIYSTYPRTNL
jgi:hypothetical protein